ncbi:MAG: WD40/YVTN/BNR-like repeat-containing protein [Acidimicrobiales bacterium]
MSASAAAGPWHLVGAPRVPGRIYGQPVCATPDQCVVVYNQRGRAGVLTSTTGGRSWRASTMSGAPSGLEALACSGNSLCLAVGYRGSLELHSVIVLERSSNGGGTFSPAALPATLAAGGRGDQLEAVACSSATSCVAAGQAMMATPPSGCAPPTCVASPSPPTYGLVVLDTTDAGVTWTVSSSANPYYSANGASCSSTGVCQMVGVGITNCTSTGSGSSRCGAAGAALGSTSSGGPTTPWSSERLPRGVFSLNGVVCVGAATCLAVGQSADSTFGHGVVLETTDAGVTWRALRPPVGSNSLMSISCLSSRTCIVTGGLGRSFEPVVYETTDAGVTWRVVARFPGLSNLVRSTCTPAGFCLAAGTVGIGPSEYGVLVAN